MKIRKVKLRWTNCYLIPVDSKYILVDTGYKWEWKRFNRRLRTLDVKVTDIAYLFLSHHHDDHCGFINNLVEKNPQIKIIISHYCSEYLKSGKNVHPPVIGYINKAIGFFISIKARFDITWTHKFPVYNGRASDILINGETSLSDIGINLKGKIIETPGHSCDSISLVLDNGFCFCGDAASNFLQFLGAKYAIISVDSWDDFYNSWDKILNLNAHTIYSARGKEFSAMKLQENLRKNKKENLWLYSE